MGKTGQANMICGSLGEPLHINQHELRLMWGGSPDPPGRRSRPLCPQKQKICGIRRLAGRANR